MAASGEAARAVVQTARDSAEVTIETVDERDIRGGRGGAAIARSRKAEARGGAAASGVRSQTGTRLKLPPGGEVRPAEVPSSTPDSRRAGFATADAAMERYATGDDA